VRLLAMEGAKVKVASRSRERARLVCEAVTAKIPGAQLTAVETKSLPEAAAAVENATVVIAAGAPGIELLSAAARTNSKRLVVAIDLSAVAPAGLEGIEITDKDVSRENVHCYGAIGVGGAKMKIHKAAIRQLFEANDQVLDAEEIYRIGQKLAG
jgi:methylenetetrahydrofolate/methylenetetrahydromethanopterin dehydrogenase (NADP+)